MSSQPHNGRSLREVSCRLIYDPGTGKPRGFGFCEYEDAETAMSAVRNLAGRELSGRPLRIDSACNAPSAGGMGLGGNMGAEGGFRGAAGPAAGQQPNPIEVSRGTHSLDWQKVLNRDLLC